MKILILLTFITTNCWISRNDETMAITDNQSMGIITDQKMANITDQPSSFYHKYKYILLVVGLPLAILGICGLSKWMGDKQAETPKDKSIKELKQELLDLFKNFKKSKNPTPTMKLIRDQLNYDDIDIPDDVDKEKIELAIGIFFNKNENINDYIVCIGKVSEKSIWDANESDELEISYNQDMTSNLKDINLDHEDYVSPLNTIPLHQKNYKKFQTFMKKIEEEVKKFTFNEDAENEDLMTFNCKDVKVNRRILNTLIESMKILMEMTDQESKKNI